MTNRDRIKNIILRVLDMALDHELADAYVDIVGCGECPYFHDCGNLYDCDEFILGKLQEDKEDRK